MSGGNCSFLIEKKGNSLNGWLQLDLRINSIPLKIGIAASACLKKNGVPLTKQDHCKWPPKTVVVPLKCMATSVPLK